MRGAGPRAGSAWGAPSWTWVTIPGPPPICHDALREFRRLQDTNGIADTLKDLTLMALAQGDRQEAAFNGRLLLEIYQARGQEQEAKRLEDLFKAGKPGRGPALK